MHYLRLFRTREEGVTEHEDAVAAAARAPARRAELGRQGERAGEGTEALGGRAAERCGARGFGGWRGGLFF